MNRLISALILGALALAGQDLKIVVNSAAVLKQVEAAGPIPKNVRLVAPDRANLAKELADADGFIGIDPQSVALIPGAKKLRWVQVPSAGLEKVLDWKGPNALRDSNVVVTNYRILQGPEIADHAFAMLLALTRQIPKYIALGKKETWQGGNQGLLELKDRTAVVIGVGGIGSNIATRAWAFGMKVIGVDPEDQPMNPLVTRYVKPDQLNEVLPLADVVFVSAPDTKESHKMLGPQQFDLMKKDSFFIAVSRGGLYDMPSLVKALDSKKLAGAGVDVTDPEPLPAGHPLWKFENAIITPHISGRSDKDAQRMISVAYENIQRFAVGKPLVNVIDKQKGY
jgi:D-2-hydroxyacid dehydrogenase (NADP+)